MATPLEILKARRLAIDNMAQQNVANQTTPQNRLGANIMNVAVELLGGFRDPNVKAYEEFQQAQPARQAAQQRASDIEGGAYSGGAFGGSGLSQSVGGQPLPENPQAVDRYLAQQNQGLMANMSPEMRPEARAEQELRGATLTPEGMMKLAQSAFQSGDAARAGQYLDYAKALKGEKPKYDRVVIQRNGMDVTYNTVDGQIIGEPIATTPSWKPDSDDDKWSLQSVINPDGSTAGSVYVDKKGNPKTPLQGGQYLGNAPSAISQTSNTNKDITAMNATDLAKVSTEARVAFGDINDKLGQVDEILRLSNLQEKEGNPQAEATLEKVMSMLSGDANISNAEVVRQASAGSYPQGIVNFFNKALVDGGSAQLTIDQRKAVARLYKDIYTKKRESKAAAFKKIWGNVVPDKETMDAFIGTRVEPQYEYKMIDGVRHRRLIN